jgi:hypothetical protein
MCGVKVTRRWKDHGVMEVKLEMPKTPVSFSGPLTLHVEVEGQAVSGTPLICHPTEVQVDGSPAVMCTYDSWQPRTVA